MTLAAHHPLLSPANDHVAPARGFARRLMPTTAEALQRIIILCIDSAEAFRRASSALQDSRVVALFKAVATRRKTRAKRLNNVLRMAGAPTVDIDALKPSERGQWVDLIAIAKRADDEAAVYWADRLEPKLDEVYTQAIVTTSGQSPLAPMLNRQYKETLRERLRFHRELRRLERAG